MASLEGFDADQVPEQEEFRALPKDVYPGIATDSERKPTRAGTGEYIQFTFEVLDGKFKGRKLWARMNIKNPNPTAQDIGQRELKQFATAADVPRPTDSGELHNIPVLLHVDVELDDRQREVNVIKKYEPIGANGQQPARSEQRAFGSARDAANATANSYSPAAASKPAGGAAQPWKR